jgi:hypothetical protein
MLGGARDEVVPRSQMQELWAIIRNRGREAPRSKKPPAGGASGSEKRKAAAVAEDDDEDEDENEKGEEVAGPGPGPKLGPASGSVSDGRKVPPRIVEDGRNKYIEFADGSHSE